MTITIHKQNHHINNLKIYTYLIFRQENVRILTYHYPKNNYMNIFLCRSLLKNLSID